MTAGSPGPVIPDRYIAALGKADPLKSMKKAPRRLARLLEKLSTKKLKRRDAPGKWSIHDVVGHLADGEVVVGARLRMVAAVDGTRVLAYDQDAFVEHLGADSASTKELLEDFAAVRRANVRLLERLPKKAFAKVGLHEERGAESIDHMVRLYAGHDLVHEAQLERLIAALKGEKRKSKRAERAPGSKVPAKAKPGAAEKAAAKAARRAKGGAKKRREHATSRPAEDGQDLPSIEGASIGSSR